MSTGSEAFDTSDSTLQPARLPARLPKGFELESFVVDGWVRDGGMAAIYRAHRRSDGGRVALKVQLPSTVHIPEIRTRFDREAEAMTRVRGSEAIVEILATDRLVDGRRYFVVEWVDGENLEERLDFLRNQDERIPVARACSTGAAIARGLADAHAAGLVHRDLKPANVMVGRDADHEVVKLVDFGVVADLRRAPLADEHDEEVMGTSAYMAPEQAEGALATPAMDLFALGVVLYEALTGTCVPPDGWTPESLPAVESLRRGVPLELAELVRACMHRDPTARPASAAEVADRLAELARHTNANASMVSLPTMSDAVRTGRTTIAPRAELVALPSEPAADDETPRATEPEPVPDPLVMACAPTDASATMLPASAGLAAPLMEHPGAEPDLHGDAAGPSTSADNRTGETEVVLTVESVVARRHATRPPHMATVVAPAVPVAPPRARRSRAPATAARQPRDEREPTRDRGLLGLFVAVALLGIGLGAMIALRSDSTEPEPAVVDTLPTVGDTAPPEPTPTTSPSAPTPSGPVPIAPDRPLADPLETPPTTEPSETPLEPTETEGEDEPEPSGPTRAQCARMRAEAEAAKASRDWASVVKATKTRACWKGSKALARRRLRVEAFAETRSYSRCVKEGGRSKDPQIVRRVSWCAGRLEG